MTTQQRLLCLDAAINALLAHDAQSINQSMRLDLVDLLAEIAVCLARTGLDPKAHYGTHLLASKQAVEALAASPEEYGCGNLEEGIAFDE